MTPEPAPQKQHPEGVPESKHHPHRFLCDPLWGRVSVFLIPGVVVAALLNPALISEIPAGIMPMVTESFNPSRHPSAAWVSRRRASVVSQSIQASVID